MRKLLAQYLQNLQQLGRRQHQSIAVRQKDAAHLVLAVMGRQRYLTGNFFILQNLKGNTSVHVAVGAFIMCAAARNAQNKAACLTGRSEDWCVIRIKKHFYYSTSFYFD